MSTNCSVIQFLEPDPTETIFTGADDHSLPIEEGGVLNLMIGVISYAVAFQQDKLQDDYDFLEADVDNTVDADPLDLTWTITARNKSGFTVQFNALPDTSNYVFNWRVRVNSISV